MEERKGKEEKSDEITERKGGQQERERERGSQLLLHHLPDK